MDLTRRAHDQIRAHFNGVNKNTAIDATCGNGFDTVFLAGLGFNEVIAFDVQTQAIENTQARLFDAGFEQVKLINEGHEHLTKHVSQPIDCAMFNFGYLPSIEPGGDSNKDITTQRDSSICGLKAALSKLSANGLISLLCYPGHPQGAQEVEAIRGWLNQIDDQYNVETHLAKSPKPTAPILFIITSDCEIPQTKEQ